MSDAVVAASASSFVFLQEAFRMKHELNLGGTITADVAPTVRVNKQKKKYKE
jgi:hypothetical protein